jgi:hypothetical protein
MTSSQQRARTEGNEEGGEFMSPVSGLSTLQRLPACVNELVSHSPDLDEAIRGRPLCNVVISNVGYAGLHEERAASQ